MSPSEFEQQLSDTLIFQISNLIDGNQAEAKEVKSTGYQTMTFNATATVIWHFSAHVEQKRVAGGRAYNHHFGNDFNEFQQHGERLKYQSAENQALRQPFLAKQIEAGKTGLVESEKTVTFYRFEPYSVHCTCDRCSGGGELRCSDCSGRGSKSCYLCGGGGRVPRSVTRYQGDQSVTVTEMHTCSNCFGSGRTTCGSCSGSGRVRCNDCEGTGFFTYYQQVDAVANPSYKILTDSPWQNRELQDTLNSKGTAFCAEKIPFILIENEPLHTDSHTFHYAGTSIVLAQHFQLKGKAYDCYAFSNPPYPFVRPPIFDDLFADELAFLRTTIPNGRVNKRKAMAFFTRYANQPVLESTMRLIAAKRVTTTQKMGYVVEQACFDFISPQMAQELGEYLNRIMDKVSPSYSKLTWFGIGSLAVLFAGLSVESYVESRGVQLDTMLSSLMTTLLALLVGASVAGVVSALSILWVRRKIPKEYRQRLRNKEPCKMLLKWGMIGTLIGISYGYFAYHGNLPKWQSSPSKWLTQQFEQQKSWFCPMLEHFDWRVCPKQLNTAEKLTQAMNEFNQSSASKIDDSEKIRHLQKFLIRHGYRIKIDGKFGRQTEQALRIELTKQGVPLQPSENLSNYYFWVKRLER